MANKLNIKLEFQDTYDNGEKDIVLTARKYILDLIFNKYCFLIKVS